MIKDVGQSYVFLIFSYLMLFFIRMFVFLFVSLFPVPEIIYSIYFLY